MNIESFCEITDSELLRRREAYNKAMRDKLDKARRRFFAYKTAENHRKYLEALNQCRGSI